MTQQLPSIGRIVHYQSYGTPGGEHPSEPLAAIVTAVDADRVGLTVFYDNGISHKTDVPFSYAETPTPGCWNWPPRV